MTKGQQIATAKSYEFWEKYKKENGLKWYNILFPNEETRTIQKSISYRVWHIEHHPEYIDDLGNGLNEIEVDYKLGRIDKPYITF